MATTNKKKPSATKKKSTTKKQPSKKLGWLRLGNTEFNLDLLNGMTEEKAVEMHKHIHVGRVKNAWKRANGKK